MQQLGPDVESGEIVVWLKELGESVAKGDPLVEVETEKAVLEMEALDTGVLVEIIAGVGAEMLVGEVIGYLEVEDC
jgi:pyruvate/2-oxoglutarate dehydrogenase complex dihydrolipoamide acyltransferase (E2) component|tara:strand:- start:368 stop:595 length:228 start_codon:yes stop_codon:yes gene_type:complete